MQVNVHEAKTTLSKLIAAALKGDEVIIARDNVPAVRLVPVDMPKSGRKPDTMKGIWPDLPDSFFFDPLPPDEQALWDGDGPDPLDPDWKPEDKK